MDRRTFQMGMLASLGAWTPRTGPPTLNGTPVPVWVDALRITCGPFDNGYRIAPGGPLNWYFINLGLLAIVQFLHPVELDQKIRRYLDLYLARLEPNTSILDVHFQGTSPLDFTLLPADSDDAYASTFISLVVRYLRASGNWAWWDTHQDTLKTMVQANVIGLIKPNGLCRTFQPGHPSPVADHGFTMNNCENYRGLRDFAGLLHQRGQTREATAYREAAQRIGQAIAIRLWDDQRQGYRVSDQDLHADTHSFYPGSCCQVFPQVYGVIDSARHNRAAYRFLHTWSPGWATERPDRFAWCILGHLAALRGDVRQARRQLQTTERLHAHDSARVTLNELGFYLRTRLLLAGQPDL